MSKLTKVLLHTCLLLTACICAVTFTAYADASGTDGWSLSLPNNAKGSWALDHDTYSGGTSSLKIINESPAIGNVFTRAITRVSMVKGKKYDISMKVKIDHAQTAIFLPENWAKRCSLTSYGTKYDWNSFSFTYVATATGSAEMSYLLEGPGMMWVDDLKVIDRETGKSIVSNGTFDDASIQAPSDDGEVYERVEALDQSTVDLYNKIMKSSSFKQETIESIRGAFKYMPVYPAKDITIDASGDDWENYPAMKMPAIPSQYLSFETGGIKDITAEAKFAHDEDNLYLYIEVLDDVYKYETNETYWTGDCIQLTISTPDENYGNEIGLTFDPDTQIGEVWGIGFSAEQREKIEFRGSRIENKTIYEARIPWNLKYEKRPKEFLLDFLVCDNDGSGRRYVLELAPGIAVGKTNKEFPLMEIVDENSKTWYSWAQTDATSLLNEETKFNYFIVNSGDEEKVFTVKDSITGESKHISVPAHEGIRKEIVRIYDEVGKQSLTVDVSFDGDTVTSTVSTEVQKKPADKEFAYALAAKLTKRAEEIQELIDRCKAKGMIPEYEIVDQEVLRRLSYDVIEDYNWDEMYRMHLNDEILENIYQNAKANLEAYLAGEKEPARVPRYVTSDVEIDGQLMYAMTELDGKREKRPVFFVGGMHAAHNVKEIEEDLQYYSALGYNTTAEEIGPNSIMVSDDKWEFQYHSGPQLDYKVIDEGPDENSSAVKVNYRSEVTPNQFFTINQTINVEPGKKYGFYGKVKAENATSFAVSAKGYEERISWTNESNMEWTEFYHEYVFNTPTTMIRLFVDGPADGVYFSNISLKEVGVPDAPELVVDGSFVNYGNPDALKFDLNTDWFKRNIAYLDYCDENNINVTYLLSPHMFFDNIVKKNGLQHPKAGSFTKYNVSHPIIREIYEKFLRTAIPLIKDYKCISNFIISNEAQYDVTYIPDFYTVPWQEWLEKTYNGDIGVLNQAYGTNYTSFSEVPLSRTETDTAKTVDIFEFNNEVFAEWHKFIADICHELAPDIPVSLKIFGWTRSYNEPISMIAGTGLEDYDFIDLNGCDYNNFLTDGLEDMAKLYWYDYMSSFRNLPVVDAEDHFIQDSSSNFYPSYLAPYCAQAIYQGAIHGRAISDMWIFARIKGNSALMDSYAYRPDAIQQISHAALDLNRLAYEIASLVNEPANVGIVASTADWLSNISGPHASYEAYQNTFFLGNKPRFIVETLPVDTTDFKAVIIPDTVYITRKMLDDLKNYVDNGGYLIAMSDDVLLKDDRNQEHDKELVDYIMSRAHIIDYKGSGWTMDNMTHPEFLSKLYDEFRNAGIGYVKILNSETGEFEPYVECNLGVNDGKVILNLANYGQEPRTVKVYFNDKLIENAYELRNRENVGGSITIDTYDSITLQLEDENVFFDTYGHWAENEILSLNKDGIINGVSASRYAPEDDITRAEFLALLVRCAGTEGAAYNGEIADVPADEWYAESCAAGIKAGVISAGDNFRPNDKITREEMCKMLVDCYENTKNAINDYADVSFTDTALISDINSVKKAVSMKFMIGNADGSFAPSDTATRAEAAAVIKRYTDALNK